ncbi:unnamed protein product, partial [Mesorhabditis spiculigera]
MDFRGLPSVVQDRILRNIMHLGERSDETAVRTLFEFALASKTCWRLVEEMPGKRWEKNIMHGNNGTFLYWGYPDAQFGQRTFRLLFGDSTIDSLLLFEDGVLPSVKAEHILIEYPEDDMLQVLKRHKPHGASYSVAEIWDMLPDAGLIQWLNDNTQNCQLRLRRPAAPLWNYIQLKHAWIEVQVDDQIDGEENLDEVQNRWIEEWQAGERECEVFCLQRLDYRRGRTYIVTGYESEDHMPPRYGNAKELRRGDGRFIRARTNESPGRYRAPSS